MVLVNIMNQRFLDPCLSSPVDSAQPTDPAGYSPPIPMPTYVVVNCRVTEGLTTRMAYKEAPSSEDVEHADFRAVPVRAGGEGSEDDQDDG